MTVTEESQGERNSSIGKWGLISLFVFGLTVFFYFDLGRYATLSSLKEHKDFLKNFTEVHYASTVTFFILIYTTQAAFSLPGAAILTLASGFLFGSLWGTLYVNIGATFGATMAFLSARYIFRDIVERKFGRKLESIQSGFSKDAFYYLLGLRLNPLFPFFLVNLASGLTRMRLSTYIAATTLGIIPGTFIYSNAGKQLGVINSMDDIASPEILGAFILLGLFAFVPIIYRWLQKRPL